MERHSKRVEQAKDEFLKLKASLFELTQTGLGEEGQ